MPFKQKGEDGPTQPFLTRCGQFEIKFDNGIVVSVINHELSYSDNRDLDQNSFEHRMTIVSCYTSDTAEVKVSCLEPCDTSKFFTSDNVKGHVSPEYLARLLEFLAHAPPPQYNGDLRRLGEQFDAHDGARLSPEALKKLVELKAAFRNAPKVQVIDMVSVEDVDRLAVWLHSTFGEAEDWPDCKSQEYYQDAARAILRGQYRG